MSANAPNPVVHLPDQRSRARVRLVDRFLLGFLSVASLVAITRLSTRPSAGWALVAYLLSGLLIVLLTRPGLGVLGRTLHEVYPLLLLVPLYTSLDLLNGIGQIHVHDPLIRQWEAMIFGEQISQTWRQYHGSIFWSTLFHLSYFAYYLIVPLPLAWFGIRGDMANLRRSVLIIFSTFLVCYLCFMLFPVAGPYYEFPRPPHWFTDNYPARLVYATLATGSSYGAAFPSSHVAGTIAATAAAWMGSRALGAILTVATILLTLGVVYCQMHYAVDASAGVLVGLGIALLLRKVNIST
ncbi:MAG: phosphatase PAP2 family protein [Gemmatimonadota bacterium]